MSICYSLNYSRRRIGIDRAGWNFSVKIACDGWLSLKNASKSLAVYECGTSGNLSAMVTGGRANLRLKPENSIRK